MTFSVCLAKALPMSIYQKYKDLFKMLQFKDIMHFSALILDIYRQDKHRQRPLTRLHILSAGNPYNSNKCYAQALCLYFIIEFGEKSLWDCRFLDYPGFHRWSNGIVAGRVVGSAEILTGAVKSINSPIKPRHFLVASCIPSLPSKAFCMHCLVHGFILSSIINAHVWPIR